VAASVKPAAVQIDLGSKLVDGLKRDPVAQDVHPRFMPALLEAISTDQAGNYVTNPAYGAERKYDGHRHAISHVNGHTVSFNRLGKQIPIPSEVALQLLSIQPMVGRRYMLDGEYVGGEYMAFDLIEMGWTAEEAASYREEPYSQRHADLTKLLGGTGIKVAPLAKTEAEKMAMIATEVEHRGEGIVFHHLGKGYMPGRQGVDVKFKLWSSATLRICAKKKQDGHNSFAVEAWKLIDGKQVWVNVGRVTLTKSPTPPAIGTYREVKMLYLGVGERLYQPEDLGERTDVTDEDCAFSKLKLKQAAERLV
jgi:ATP-dependent DNA ligase